MRVLYFTNLPAPYKRDFFYELGKLCDLTVLYEEKSGKNRNPKWESEVRDNYKEVFLRRKKIWKANFYCPDIIKYVKDNSYDIIVMGIYSSFTAIKGICYLKKHHKAFFISSDGGYVKEENRLKKLLKTKLISSASAWMSSGIKTDEYLLYYGANKKHIYEYYFTSLKKEDIIVNVNSSEKKTQLRKQLNIKENKIVLYVGQFIYRKGIDVLLNVAKNCEDIGFYLIGFDSHNEYDCLKDGKSNLQNVHILPFMNKKKLLDYYDSADVFVLPTREDVWGLVINEAMARGLPVVTTDKCIAGVELVENGVNGYIVKAESVSELENAIKKCVVSIGNAMGQVSLSKIQNYTFESMSECYYEAFKNESGSN